MRKNTQTIVEFKTNLKEKLLEIFENKNVKFKKYTLSELKSLLDEECSIQILKEALRELENEGKIIYNGKKRTYQILGREMGYVSGKLITTRYGDSFIYDGPIKYHVDVEDLNDALNGDLVILKITDDSREKYKKARVDKILKRESGLIIVEVVDQHNGKYLLKPYNTVLDHSVVLDNDSKTFLLDGERIEVKINKVGHDGQYHADYVQSVGHKTDPDADLKAFAVTKGIAINFTEEAKQEAYRLPICVSPEDKKGRLDLTDKLIFTIDGENTKDRDDAVSIEKNKAGNFVLGVHIADVSHYVQPGMQLWKEALDRGVSVYMVNTVIPMLPRIISNGICSLNPGEERLTESCFVEVSPQGKILNYDFKESVIKSRKAMTYEDINKMYLDHEFVPGYEEFFDALEMLRELSNAAEKEKVRRGCIDLGSSDLEIVMDEHGNPIEFRPKQQRIAEKMIEDSMLYANECYANYMILPAPRRVHEAPDPENVQFAYETIEKSGIKVKKIQNIVNNNAIQAIIKSVKDAEEREIVSAIMLRAMCRARYDVEELGHFGLALQKYGHFTAPIRRASDLLGHYMLKCQRSGKMLTDDYDGLAETIQEHCNHISQKSNDAKACERKADDFQMSRYISLHLGEEFNVIVTYINSRAIFVKTHDGIRGVIDPRDIEGDKVVYDSERMKYKLSKTKKSIKIGSRLIVTAKGTDFDEVHFNITRENLQDIKKLELKR